MTTDPTPDIEPRVLQMRLIVEGPEYDALAFCPH